MFTVPQCGLMRNDNRNSLGKSLINIDSGLTVVRQRVDELMRQGPMRTLMAGVVP